MLIVRGVAADTPRSWPVAFSAKQSQPMGALHRPISAREWQEAVYGVFQREECSLDQSRDQTKFLAFSASFYYMKTLAQSVYPCTNLPFAFAFFPRNLRKNTA